MGVLSLSYRNCLFVKKIIEIWTLHLQLTYLFWSLLVIFAGCNKVVGSFMMPVCIIRVV